MTMTIQLAPLPLGVFPSAPAESPNATHAPSMPTSPGWEARRAAG
jgi:hypothetical protein